MQSFVSLTKFGSLFRLPYQKLDTNEKVTEWWIIANLTLVSNELCITVCKNNAIQLRNISVCKVNDTCSCFVKIYLFLLHEKSVQLLSDTFHNIASPHWCKVNIEFANDFWKGTVRGRGRGSWFQSCWCWWRRNADDFGGRPFLGTVLLFGLFAVIVVLGFVLSLLFFLCHDRACQKGNKKLFSAKKLFHLDFLISPAHHSKRRSFIDVHFSIHDTIPSPPPNIGTSISLKLVIHHPNIGCIWCIIGFITDNGY